MTCEQKTPLTVTSLALLGVSLFALACAPSTTHTLSVQLHSDLQPGVDFAYVEAELSTVAAPENVRRQRFEPEALASVSGTPIAEFDAVVPGDVTLRVIMRNRDDGLVAVREVRVRVVGPYVASILVGRACQGVRCPRSADDPGAVDCIAGRCFDPDCFENPGSCEQLECHQDSECPAAVAECASSRCVQGACLAVVDLGGCADGEYCDLGFGCRPEPTDLCPADGCDDGIDCTADECVLGRCEFTPMHAMCDEDPTGFCDATMGCEYTNLCPEEGCDDGVACTDDACVSGRCVFTADHSQCDTMPRGFCDDAAGCEYLDPCPTDGVCARGEMRSCSECVSGTQTCLRDCQWGECAPPSGVAEVVCNGVDDDCNATTSDTDCPADSACSDGSCQPLAPRLDEIVPGAMSACSCQDFTLVGAHFDPDVEGYFLVTPESPPVRIDALIYDSPTRVRVPNVCAPSGTRESQVYLQNPDRQRTPQRSVHVGSSDPVVTSVSPATVAWGETFCPSFRLSRNGGACHGARWAVGDCMGNTVPDVGGELTVDTTSPDVATATGSNCFDLGPTTAPARAYCVWVVNPDGGESSHTGIEVTVTE